MKLGARIFKTGFAVAIALSITRMLDFPSAVFAGFAAVFAIQPSIYQSFKITIRQLYANFIGVLTGIIAAYLIGNNAIIVGLAVVLVILIARFLKFEKSAVSIALIAVISVMETTSMEIYQFGLLRFTTMVLGILSAFVVNLLFIPPKYEATLLDHVNQLSTEIIQWLRVTTRNLSDDPSLKSEVYRLQGELDRMDELYLLFSEERIYFSEKRAIRAKKLVLFRQFIKVNHDSFSLLKTIKTLDNRTNMIPKDILVKLVQIIDAVVHRHERMLLSFKGKIKQQETEDKSESSVSDFVDTLLNLYQDNEKDYLIFLPLATKLLKYDHELSHLQTLLNSYERVRPKEKAQVIHKQD